MHQHQHAHQIHASIFLQNNACFAAHPSEWTKKTHEHATSKGLSFRNERIVQDQTLTRHETEDELKTTITIWTGF